MKKTLLFCGVLTLIGASAAFAVIPGVNLGWSTDQGCWPESGVTAKTFACTSNTGSASMTGSFAIGVDLADFQAMGAIIDGQSSTATLPDWWQMSNTGSCRQAALSTSADFTAAPQTSCVDPFGGQAAGGIAAYQTQLFPAPFPINVPAANRLRLKIGYGLTFFSPLTAGVEYYAFRANITYTKTVGSPSCAGCSTPVTIVLNEVQATPTLQVDTIRLTTPINNQCITWQGTDVPCSAVPTRNRTWGEVKSLYR